MLVCATWFARNKQWNCSSWKTSNIRPLPHSRLSLPPPGNRSFPSSLLCFVFPSHKASKMRNMSAAFRATVAPDVKWWEHICVLSSQSAAQARLTRSVCVFSLNYCAMTATQPTSCYTGLVFRPLKFASNHKHTFNYRISGDYLHSCWNPSNPPTVTELKAEAPSAVHNKTGLHLWKVSTVPVYCLIQNKRLYWNNCVYCIYYKLYILQAGPKSEYQKWHLSNKDGLQCARPVWKPKQLRDEGCGRIVGIIPRKDASFITCFSKGHSGSSFMKGNEIHDWVVQEKSISAWVPNEVDGSLICICLLICGCLNFKQW